MKILKMTGSVPNDSVLPTWNEAFPALIDPSKIKLRDGFDSYSGESVDGKNVQYSTVGTVTWLGTANIVEDGYLKPTGTANSLPRLQDTSSNCEVYGRVSIGSLGSTVAVGVAARAGNTDNCIRGVITGAGNLSIHARNSGSTINLASAPFEVIAGREYDLRLVLEDEEISLYLDNELALTATSSLHIGNTGSGVWFQGSVDNKCHEFIAGY